jgi:hypothetical protein
MKWAFIHPFHFFLGPILGLFCKCIGNARRVDIQHFNLFDVLVHIQGNTPLVVVSFEHQPKRLVSLLVESSFGLVARLTT